MRKLVIETLTQEDWIEVVQYFIKSGRTWYSGCKYINKSWWRDGSCICIDNKYISHGITKNYNNYITWRNLKWTDSKLFIETLVIGTFIKIVEGFIKYADVAETL